MEDHQDIIEFFSVSISIMLSALLWVGYLIRQIQKRREAERALLEQMIFMRSVIDGTPHPIYVRNRKGVMLICNTGYLKAVGLERDQVIGKPMSATLLDERSAELLKNLYAAAMSEGVSISGDRVITMNCGKELTIYHWVLPYTNAAGMIKGVICGWIDIGERQQMLDELKEAKDEAEMANRAKTTFLAIMSHEIRTPMNAVIGTLEMMLKNTETRPSDVLSLEVAAGAARELQNLVGDILDIARIESGRLSLTPARMGLKETIESVVRMFDGGARQKGIFFDFSFDSAADCDVWGDSLRIKQVISNLLGNAIKFTIVGGVSLEVKVESLSEDLLSLLILVRDSGIGISLEDQRKLFSPFSQASNNNQSARNGSGLGLAISKSLSEMMGGGLELSSELGKGTLVSFSLQLKTLPALPFINTEPDVDTLLTNRLSILVVDDYPANRLLLTQQLEFLGHDVQSANDGVEGLAAWRKGCFDIVITDISMPFMRGEELALKIRAEEMITNQRRCRILGFTANARSEERLRCLEAGMDDCLFKPLRLNDLSVHVGVARIAPSANAYIDPASRKGSGPQGGLMDFKHLEALAQGNEVEVKKLINHLRTSNLEDLRCLRKLYHSNDFNAIAALAHKIKGGAQLVELHDVIESCEKIEWECGQKNLGRVRFAVKKLERSMIDLKQSLD